MDSRSFLTIGSPAIYRKEQRISPIFDKKGIDLGSDMSESQVDIYLSQEIEKRLGAGIVARIAESPGDQLGANGPHAVLLYEDARSAAGLTQIAK